MSPLNENPLIRMLDLYKRGLTEVEIREVMRSRLSEDVLNAVMIVYKELSEIHAKEVLELRDVLYNDVYTKKRLKITLEYLLDELRKYKSRCIVDFEDQLRSGKNILEIK